MPWMFAFLFYDGQPFHNPGPELLQSALRRSRDYISRASSSPLYTRTRTNIFRLSELGLQLVAKPLSMLPAPVGFRAPNLKRRGSAPARSLAPIPPSAGNPLNRDNRCLSFSQAKRWLRTHRRP